MALDKWNADTLEAFQLKTEFSQEAVRLNSVKNQHHANIMHEQRQQHAVSKAIKDEIHRKQVHLMQTASRIGMFEPKEGQPVGKPPSVFPASLESFAAHGSLVAPIRESIARFGSDSIALLACDAGSCANESVNQPSQQHQSIAHVIASRDLQDSGVDMSLIDELMFSKQGVHGLGDEEFAISEHLLETACQEIGFIDKSNKQFKSEHDSVTLKTTQPLSFDEENGVESSNFCQRTYGRFCKEDIRSNSQYGNAVGLVKSIVRVLSSRRKVKAGKLMYLGPDTPWPVLLVHHGESLHARLGMRVSFKPLELDFIHLVQCPDPYGHHPGVLCFRLVFDKLPNSHMRCPRTDITNEFAVWFSQLNADMDLKCQIFWDYDLVEGNSIIRIRIGHHESATALEVGDSSFASLLPAKGQCDDQDPDSREVLANVSKLLLHLGDGSKKRQTPKQSHHTRTTSQVKRKRSSKRKRHLPELLAKTILQHCCR